MSHLNLDPVTLLADVRRQVITIAQSAWPELAVLVDDTLADPLDPFILLPICTGIACGAQPAALTPVAAVVAAAALALHILDDCADEDNPYALYRTIGPARATNAATALTTAALRSLLHLPIDIARRTRLLDGYLQAFLQVCQGQDQEFRGLARSLPDYCTIVQAKTVAAFEFAALAGAYGAINDIDALEQCRACGVHLGWMIQMLDDIEALWFPDEPNDLRLERQTFPVLFGLSLEHPAVPQLRQLCAAERFDAVQVRAVLDSMGVRRQLMNHALDHRDRALASLDPPLQPEGRALLQLWLDWLYRDGQRLLGL